MQVMRIARGISHERRMPREHDSSSAGFAECQGLRGMENRKKSNATTINLGGAEFTQIRLRV